jgi:hypothetical protein
MGVWDGGGGGGAWWGEAPGRWVVPTGLRGVGGHRLSTRGREGVTDLSKAKTKAEGDGAAGCAAQKLGSGVNSRRRERFAAKNFIGRGLCRRARVRSCARWRFRRACRARCLSLMLILLLLEFVRAASRVRTNRVGVCRQVSLNQPSCQQGAAVLVNPRVEQLHDFLSYIGRQIQSRNLERLQSGFRRRQKKFPVHFLLGMLSRWAS